MKEKRKSVVLLTVLLLLALLVQPVQASTKIGLSKTNYKVMVGYTYPLYLKGVPLSQMEKVKWTSSKSSVVTVSGTNWVTGTDGISEYDSKYAMALLTPKKKGTAVITARYKRKNYRCKVTVSSMKSTITIGDLTASGKTMGDKSVLELDLDTSKVKTAKATVKGAVNSTVTWHSNNPNIVTISRSGKITPKKGGRVKIWCHVKSKDAIGYPNDNNNLVTFAYTLNVKAKKMVGVSDYKKLVDKGYSSSQTEAKKALVELNAWRKEKGLSEVKLDTTLSKSAGYTMKSHGSYAGMLQASLADRLLGDAATAMNLYDYPNMLTLFYGGDVGCCWSGYTSGTAGMKVILSKGTYNLEHKNTLSSCKKVGIYVDKKLGIFVITSK